MNQPKPLAARSSLMVALSLPLLTSPLLAADPLPKIELRDAYPALKFDRPLWMEQAADGRTFVLEQKGKIWLLPKDSNSPDKKLFLDIEERRPFIQNEEGLLAMALHPQFKANGKFYIFYTTHSPLRSVLSEMQVLKSDANFADPSTERVLLVNQRPYWNHDGAAAVFGPDGFLYLSLGDGGLGGDPHTVGQSRAHLLGKILRIDVNSQTGKLPYGIPKDNPFVAKDENGNLKPDPFDTRPEGIRPEIWATGLRNVWRMSFDRETGALWAGDVGQDKFEEVDIITKGGNYGWSVRESFHAFKDQRPQGKTIDPIIEYAHQLKFTNECKFPEHGIGVSITGGYVYRGKKNPGLRGVYIYGDYQMGTIWGLRYENDQLGEHGEISKPNGARNISSFAQDRDGELYVLAFDGKIYGIAEAGK